MRGLLGRTLGGLFSGNALGSLLAPPVSAHSFVPATTTSAALFTPPNFPTLEQAKLDARYRVGGAAEDLFSGNIHWSVPLLSLPGRAGLDLNLQLHYNSLVWIKHNSWVSYDYDYYPTLTPGFRTGFPELAGPYTIGTYETYIVTLPTGRRVEMRKLTTNKYEAIDSSYLYLEYNPTAQTMTLTSTDGTRFVYTIAPDDGWWHCTQILDSNGNYISVAYKSIGDPSWPLVVIDKIIDTLGREIVFSYDANLHLEDITQTRGGQTFTWAHFDYDNWLVNPDFASSVGVDGPVNTQVPMISRVITADGARHTFAYDKWGQAENFYLYGEADNQRAITDYNFPDFADAGGTKHSDCPRPSSCADGVWGWPGQTYDPVSQFGWVNTTFGYDAAGETYVQVTTPDGVLHKELFYTTSDKRGLPSGSETWYGGQKKKWTTATWVSDSGVYPVRPRVIETNIYDDANGDGTADNRRRTTIDYLAIGTIKLPYSVTEYEANASTILRTTQTSYITSSNYINRRLIGLPQWQYLYDGTNTLQAKTEYLYDTVSLQNITGAISNHDATFNTGFTYRGNLTKMRRYNTPTTPDDGITDDSYTETTTGYDINGSVAYTEDAIGATHRTTYSYTDAYLDPPSSTYTPPAPTYAYPTTVTDPDNYSSTVKYGYDRGLVVQATNPKGATTNYAYDSRWRLERTTSAFNGAYTRNVYDFGHNWVQTWTTVNTTAEETAVLHLLDGAGRERMTINEHPGSTGGLSASYQVYDIVGRVKEQSRPTEIDSVTWGPTGDDTAYVYSTQSYDWKGRPAVTTNPDGSTQSITYTGCGCAGGDIAQITDEATRKRDVYRDVLGRVVKTEALNWDGSVYSTQTTTYNARDQITQVNQIQGSSGASQNTTKQYDGYGRLWKSRSAIETDDTIYQYYSNDTLLSVADARQVGGVRAKATFTYYNRPLIQDITYTVPAGVAATPNVHYEYDQLGGRTLMTDGLGSATYVNDALGRMESETRSFGSQPGPYNAALPGTYKLTYLYNLVGQVKRVGYEASAKLNDNSYVDYAYDKAGRMTAVTGSPFAGVGTFTSAMKYSAWGELRSLSYGNNTTSTFTYNGRQQLQSLQYKNPSGVSLMEKSYQYHPDGKIKFSDDAINQDFDRAFKYDQVGRVENAWSGQQARNYANNLPVGTDVVPYSLTYQYDVWGNQTSQAGNFWSEGINQTSTYTNLRRSGWQYDAAGNVLSEGGLQMQYDAAGRNSSAMQNQIEQVFDGDGLVGRRVVQGNPAVFYLRSTVLGGKVIVEIDGIGTNVQGSNPRGEKLQSYVYYGEMRVATQFVRRSGYTAGPPLLLWKTVDPITGTEVGPSADGTYIAGRNEPDPQGVGLPLVDPINFPPPPPAPEEPSYFGGGGGWNPNQPKFTYNGFPVDAAFGQILSESQFALYAPAEEYISIVRHGQRQWARWQSFSDGYQGYVPVGAKYIGNGGLSYGDGSRPSLYKRAPGAERDTNLAAINGASGEAELAVIGGGMKRNLNSNELSSPNRSSQDDGKRLIGGDKLSDCLRNLLAPYFQELDLTDVSVHHYIPLGPRLAADPEGYTFGNDVYFKDYKPSDIEGFKTLVHELKHVVQFKQMGWLGFVKNYYKEYKENKDKGMADGPAYYYMKVEVDAREMEEAVLETCSTKTRVRFLVKSKREQTWRDVWLNAQVKRTT